MKLINFYNQVVKFGRLADPRKDKKKIKEILEQGREKAATVANKTLREVKERMGLV